MLIKLRSRTLIIFQLIRVTVLHEKFAHAVIGDGRGDAVFFAGAVSE